jgi:hypothetical protein
LLISVFDCLWDTTEITKILSILYFVFLYFIFDRYLMFLYAI